MTKMPQLPGQREAIVEREAARNLNDTQGLSALGQIELWAARWLMRPRTAGFICLLILCVFVVAGLWPFVPIANQVSWLESRPGLRFGANGVAYSTGALTGEASGACTIEIWVVPSEADGTSTLLSFYGPDGGQGIALQRYEDSFRIDRETGGRRKVMYFPAKALYEQQPVFLTVVHGSSESSVYVDGVEVWRSDLLRAAPGDCAGGLGVGHPAKGRSSWKGDIWGLAIYGRELSPEEVQGSYMAWRSDGRPREEVTGKPKILYLFNEGEGDRVRDHGSAGLDLTIPPHYQDIRRSWFQPPPELEYWTAGTLEDILVNIAGFVPFGAALCAFLSARLRLIWAGLAAVAGGLAVSLTIEYLQVFLPTRDSDVTDLITNTLGTALGVGLLFFWRRRLFRMGVGTGAR